MRHHAAAAFALVLAAATISADSRVVLDNARVTAVRTTGRVTTGLAHAPAVVVQIDDGGGAKAGEARWVPDAAAVAANSGTVVIVQPKPRTAASPAAPAGSKPGEGTFSGMSFSPLFENDEVSVLRARMDVGAREAFHTHASDTVVVHLSGGAIEDTANGKTVTNRWKPGDVEFESAGSSHSAKNAGAAVDVVLVALKP